MFVFLFSFVVMGKNTMAQGTGTGAVLPNSFECASITEIPADECEALATFYEQMDGENWQYNGEYFSGEAWFSNIEPCDWHGIRCGDGRVTSLYLGSTVTEPFGLSGALDPSIANLTQLSDLWLDNNELTSIPASIGNLNNLTYLSLNNNLLTSMPDEVGNLTNLETLGVQSNRLASIPSSLGDLTSLSTLSFYDNQINAIPDELWTLTELTILSLSTNHIRAISPAIGDLTNLTFLDLGGNYFGLWPDTITNLTNLETLNMGTLCEPDATDLQTWLDNIPSVNYRSRVLCSEVEISGQLWEDVDSDEILNEVDKPIEYKEVQIYYPIGNGEVISTQITTDENGFYSINSLPFATYTVTVDIVQDVSGGVFIGAGTCCALPRIIYLSSESDNVVDGSYVVTLSSSDFNQPTYDFIYTENSPYTPTPTNNVPCPTICLPQPSTNTPTPTHTPVPPTDTPVPPINTPTVTSIPTLTPTMTFTPTPIPMATFTPTLIPTVTFTPTPTPTATLTPTLIPTPTQDQFEGDDSCEEATLISTGGIGQNHTFYDAGDMDWIQFETVAGEIYQVIVEVDGESRADIVAETYSICDVVAYVDNPFNDYVVINVVARHDGYYYVKLFNEDETVFGDDVDYRVSVTQLREVQTGSVIIVAGRETLDDDLQKNIHNVTDNVYRLFHEEEGYPHDNIHYMVTDAYDRSDPNIIIDTREATGDNLRDMIINGVYNQVNNEQPLTIYMMSHGSGSGFYLDDVNGQHVTPADLDSWLDELEELRPGLEINLIIDACFAGSFVENPDETVAGENRVVIGSSAANQFAWSSFGSANFSDFFLLGLQQRRSLKGAFEAAQAAVSTGIIRQNAWINDDDDSRPNEAEDGDVAATRFLLSYNSLEDPTVPELPISSILSEPIIDPDSVSVTITELTSVNPILGNVTVAGFEVRVTADSDSLGVAAVQAVLYRPSLSPDELPTIIELENVENDIYQGSIALLEQGNYEVRFYAQGAVPDGVNVSLEARPVSETFTYGTVPLSVSQTASHTSYNIAVWMRFWAIIPLATLTVCVVCKNQIY